MSPGSDTSASGLRARVRHVIFGADTPAGKAFDVVLLVMIAGSVLLVMLESVRDLDEYADLFWTLELVVTGVFTLEYLARLWSVDDRRAYATGFFGVIDLAAILPVYLSLIVPGAASFLMIRALRLLRIFRVFKMARWLGEANFLVTAMRSSARKIAVFLLTVLLVNLIVGASMYVIEGSEGGFDNIFRGVYWSIVTMSTVGFGDITPQTGLGQFLASGLMILGYSIIAVPTGIVSAQMAGMGGPGGSDRRRCPGCGMTEHRDDAAHCWSCGDPLTGEPVTADEG